MDESSAFILGNQSAAVAMSALHAAAGMMSDKSNPAPPTLPFYPYVTTPSLHNGVNGMPASSPPPISTSNASGTPFGINDILSRGGGGIREHFGSSNGVDDCTALKYSTVGPTSLGGRACTTAAAAVAAQAAAMLFNNTSHVMHSSVSPNVRLAKPLTDLPGRPPIYWPGVLADDWHEKLSMHGKMTSAIIDLTSVIPY